MGRGIGSALVVFILNYAKENNIEKVVGMLTETESNWRIKPLYENRGFKKIKVDGKKTFYEYAISDGIPTYPEWMKVKFLEKELEQPFSSQES